MGPRMRYLGLGVLILCCIPLMAISIIASAEVDVFLCGGPDHTEPSHVAYQGEGELTLCVVLDENATDLNSSVFGGLILSGFEYIPYLWGPLPAGQMWVTEDQEGVRLNTDAQLGNYILTITVGYTNDPGERIHSEFQYPVEYRSALDVRRFILHRELGEDRLELVVETFEDVDELDVVLFDWISGDLQEIVAMNVTPGVRTFATRVSEVTVSDDIEDNYGFMIDVTLDGHHMTYTDMDDDIDIEIVDERGAPAWALSALIALVIIATFVLVYTVRRRKARRAGDGAGNEASR